jgi:hypothetical protein
VGKWKEQSGSFHTTTSTSGFCRASPAWRALSERCSSTELLLSHSILI